MLSNLEKVDVEIKVHSSLADNKEADDPESPPLLDGVSLSIDGALLTNKPVTLVATLSDENIDSSALSYSWKIRSGPGTASILPDDQEESTVSFDTDGSYEIIVQVSEPDGDAIEASVVIVWDTTPPSDLKEFTVNTGTTVGTIELTLNLPDLFEDYNRLRVRRTPGKIPDSCDEGEDALMLESGDLTGMLDVVDVTPTYGDEYGYRVCIFDLAGNVNDTHTADTQPSKAHLIFASSTIVAGNLGSGSGTTHEKADEICRLAAQGSARERISQEPHWRAVLSDDQIFAKDHLQVRGRVEVEDGSLIAASSNDLFSGDLEISVFFNENNAVAPALAWTGSTSDGSASGENCLNWTSNLVTNNGGVGATNSSNVSWIEHNPNPGDDTCNQQRALYCISQRL